MTTIVYHSSHQISFCSYFHQYWTFPISSKSISHQITFEFIYHFLPILDINVHTKYKNASKYVFSSHAKFSSKLAVPIRLTTYKKFNIKETTFYRPIQIYSLLKFYIIYKLTVGVRLVCQAELSILLQFLHLLTNR